jgi:hypothetical protein
MHPRVCGLLVTMWQGGHVRVLGEQRSGGFAPRPNPPVSGGAAASPATRASRDAAMWVAGLPVAVRADGQRGRRRWYGGGGPGEEDDHPVGQNLCQFVVNWVLVFFAKNLATCEGFFVPKTCSGGVW